jgi:hypothetical protein
MKDSLITDFANISCIFEKEVGKGIDIWFMALRTQVLRSLCLMTSMQKPGNSSDLSKTSLRGVI